MERILYLHIGMGRCGSSTIQVLARQNRLKLLQAGVAYPSDVELGAPVGASHAGNATGIAQRLKKERGDKLAGAKIIASMCDHLRTLTVPNCLLSSEFLYSLHMGGLAELKTAFNQISMRVVVICYIREQCEWIISKFGQAVKSRNATQDLKETILQAYNMRLLDYSTQFRHLRDIFGAENLIIRVFERDRLHDNDVRKDFIHLLGIDSDGLVFGQDDLNAAGNLLQVGLMQVMNRHPKNKYFRFNNIAFLKETRDLCRSGLINNSRDLYRLVEPEILYKLAKHFEEKNEIFRQEFLPELEGPLFKSSIPNNYQMMQPSELFSADSILLFNHYVERFLERKHKARVHKNTQATTS